MWPPLARSEQPSDQAQGRACGLRGLSDRFPSSDISGDLVQKPTAHQLDAALTITPLLLTRRVEMGLLAPWAGRCREALVHGSAS